MYGRTNNNGDPYFGELSIPLNLPSGGFYEISFWALIYCGQDECEEAGDSIKVKAGDTELIINYANIGQERVWKKMSFRFNESPEPVKKITHYINDFSFEHNF